MPDELLDVLPLNLNLVRNVKKNNILLSLIAYRCRNKGDYNGFCAWSASALAKDLGLAEKTIRKELSSLIENGYILKSGYKNKHIKDIKTRTCVYILSEKTKLLLAPTQKEAPTQKGVGDTTQKGVGDTTQKGVGDTTQKGVGDTTQIWVDTNINTNINTNKNNNIYANDICVNASCDDVQNNDIQNAKEAPTQKGANDTLELLFAEWYSSYPRKKGKQGAKKAFLKIMKLTGKKEKDTFGEYAGKSPAEKVAMMKQVATRQARETEPQYIPYPSTWLNGYRWQDSTDTAPTANSTEGYSKAYADEFGV